jgi:hypothetical protein
MLLQVIKTEETSRYLRTQEIPISFNVVIFFKVITGGHDTF